MNTINTNSQAGNDNQVQVETHQKATLENYFAQPYSLDAHGFYFKDLEEYTAKAEALRDAFGNKVEEFEIQCIDGECELFNACKISQANLAKWFDEVLEMDDSEKTAIFYMVSNGVCDLEEALDKVNDVTISEGRLEAVAEEIFDEQYLESIPQNLRNYIDYAAFANDLQQGGDLVEFEYDGQTYTCTNANSI